MTFVSTRLFRYLPIIGAALLVGLFAAQDPLPAQAQQEEPIASVGHGAFFDRSGRQVAPTVEWVGRAQAWYRARLLAGLTENQQGEFAVFERRLGERLNVSGQARLVVQQRSLDWLVARTPRTAANGRMRGKLNALKSELGWRLPRSSNPRAVERRERFQLGPQLEARLRQPEFDVRVGGNGPLSLVTTNSGLAYNNECGNAANRVPVPPPINQMDPAGTSGWRSLGFIPTGNQFIVSTPAEVRVYQSADGMCIALPRYWDDTLAVAKLDGVICLSSRPASRACFWDNQRSGARFDIPAGTIVPIGYTTTPGGLYQAGGAELLGGSGGVCTDCHAGENPYIIHPEVELENAVVAGGSTTFTPNGIFMGAFSSAPLNLPTFAPNRYDPIVAAAWPQNQLSQTPPYVPTTCNNCHQQGGAGRFPHLSPDLPDYCTTILPTAIAGNTSIVPNVPPTMPASPYTPGSMAGTTPVNDFLAWCGVPATSGPSDRGDPHLTTTNGINYDFQAAGEFVALRNSSTGFELQTRQTPVLTSFTPGANPYTGLASCVSLNTAAAVRVGRHRISYQPSAQRAGNTERMQLRIDGRPVTLAARGVNLGGGNRIALAASGGGIDVRLDDGTRLFITPNYWASEGYWYLNVEVLDSPAREGTMGHIMGSNWLPFAPNGTSFGPAPGSLAARHGLLNGLFADAWRVTNATSLFDYAPGTSTASFTNRAWPPPPGGTCTALRGNPLPGGQPRRPVAPMRPDVAERLCRPIQDRAARDNCVFDLTATGNAAMAEDYLRTLRARGAPILYRPYAARR